jgi:hypothetical protein
MRKPKSKLQSMIEDLDQLDDDELADLGEEIEYRLVVIGGKEEGEDDEDDDEDV